MPSEKITASASPRGFFFRCLVLKKVDFKIKTWHYKFENRQNGGKSDMDFEIVRMLFVSGQIQK